MPTPRVIVDHDVLEAISGILAGQANEVQAAQRDIRSSYDNLRGGGWIGLGANLYFQEMEDIIFPVLGRLADALAQAARLTDQISKIFLEAEDEAGRALGSSPQAAGAVIAGRGTADDGAGPGGEAQPEAVAGGRVGPGASGQIDTGPSAPTNPSQPLAVRDANGMFTEAYIDQMVGLTLPGMDSARLNGAMERLLENPPAAERDQLLAQIAAERGRPLPEIRAEFEKFQQLQAVQRATGRTPDALDYTSEALDFSDFPDHLGSAVSLRYGKVVGDVFGIDPVFGALLNPTGGIMGPGSSALPQPGPDQPLAYHSVFHDAGGYLLKTHGLGPGYDYLGRETEYDPAHELVGQKSGLRYWHGRMDSPGPDWVTENAAEGAMDAFIWKEGGRRAR